MNDSTYAYDISRNLLAMARVVFVPFERTMNELEQHLHLDKQEIQAVLGSATPPQPAAPNLKEPTE